MGCLILGNAVSGGLEKAWEEALKALGIAIGIVLIVIIIFAILQAVAKQIGKQLLAVLLGIIFYPFVLLFRYIRKKHREKKGIIEPKIDKSIPHIKRKDNEHGKEKSIDEEHEHEVRLPKREGGEKPPKRLRPRREERKRGTTRKSRKEEKDKKPNPPAKRKGSDSGRKRRSPKALRGRAHRKPSGPRE